MRRQGTAKRVPAPTALAIVLGVAGCGGAVVAEPPPASIGVPVVVTVPSAAAPTGFRTPSQWQGRYVCAQGVTGLTLLIQPVGPTEVSATFDFFAVPENPTVPSGSYTMRGHMDDRTGSVELAPDRWIARPEDYVMVGMSGLVDATTGTLRGRILNPSCGGFELLRAN